MQVDFLVKNRVSEESFEDAVYEWLSQGDYTPDDIIENIITEHNLMYLPVHHYTSNYRGVASASLGYSRREYYYVYNPETKRQEKKSRTVTDWIPHSQPAMGSTSVSIYAGEEKFSFMESFIQGSSWRKHELIRPDGEASRNHQLLEKFESLPSDSWNNKGLNKSQSIAESQIRASLPSQLVRNLNVNIKHDITGVASLIAPYWIFMYDYNDQLYYVTMDGNSPERVSGTRPENKARKNQVIALRFFGYPATIYSAYLLSYSYNEAYSDKAGFKTIGIFLLCTIVGIWLVERVVRTIKNASKARRKAKLEKRKQAKLSQA